MDEVLLTRGVIYTPEAPRATAMLVADGRVAWVGSADSARSLGVGTVRDLGGALVTPAFVEPNVPHDDAQPDDLRALATLGIASVHAISAPGAAPPSATAQPDLPEVLRTTVMRLRGGGLDEQAATLADRIRGVRPVALAPDDPDDAADLLDRIAAQVGEAALRAATVRVDVAGDLSAEVAERLAGRGAVAVVTPEVSDLAAVAATGLAIALSSGLGSSATRTSPWQTVARASERHPSGLSPRAALRAHTSGGRRAARQGSGVLAVGEPATFAVWDVAALAVAAPDERVRRWSTDPRAGVPALPDLSEGAAEPVCLATVRNGVTLHRLPLAGR